MSFHGFILSILSIVAAVWVIVDVLTKQKKMEDLHKVLWILGAVFFSIITALIYYFVVKRK